MANGAGGRPRLPTVIKQTRGTLQPSRINHDEPEASYMEVGTEPPPWVRDGKARRAWRELSKLLTDVRVLTTMDPVALGLLVDAFGDYLAAKETLRKEGNYYRIETEKYGTTIKAHPAMAVKNDAWVRLERILGKFGMNPSDRTRVKAATDAEKKDPFEQWASRAS